MKNIANKFIINIWQLSWFPIKTFPQYIHEKFLSFNLSKHVDCCQIVKNRECIQFTMKPKKPINDFCIWALEYLQYTHYQPSSTLRLQHISMLQLPSGWADFSTKLPHLTARPCRNSSKTIFWHFMWLTALIVVISPLTCPSERRCCSAILRLRNEIIILTFIYVFQKWSEDNIIV